MSESLRAPGMQYAMALIVRLYLCYGTRPHGSVKQMPLHTNDETSLGVNKGNNMFSYGPISPAQDRANSLQLQGVRSVA